MKVLEIYGNQLFQAFRKKKKIKNITMFIMETDQVQYSQKFQPQKFNSSDFAKIKTTVPKKKKEKKTKGLLTFW